MSFFFPRLKREVYSLVFDVGSGSVKGAVVKFTEKPGAEVTFYTEEKISFAKNAEAEKHVESLKKTLSSVVEKILKKDKIKFESIFYIFSAPWSSSETRLIRIKENKPIRLTEQYLNKLIADQEKIVLKETPGSRIIEKRVVDLKISGYPVADLNNRQTTEAEVAVFFSSVSETIIKSVEGAVGRHFIPKKTFWHTSSLAIFSTIRDLFPNHQDFVSVSFGDEMTEMSIIKNGIVFGEVSYPFGRNTFVRRLSDKTKTTEAVADSVIKMTSLKHTDDLAALRTNTNISSIASEWYGEFDIAMKHFMEKLYVPHVIFFVSPHDLSATLVNKIKETGFEVVPLIARKISSPVKIDDIMFKISLMFLDKIYKI